VQRKWVYEKWPGFPDAYIYAIHRRIFDSCIVIFWPLLCDVWLYEKYAPFKHRLIPTDVKIDAQLAGAAVPAV